MALQELLAQAEGAAEELELENVCLSVQASQELERTKKQLDKSQTDLNESKQQLKEALVLVVSLREQSEVCVQHLCELSSYLLRVYSFLIASYDLISYF